MAKQLKPSSRNFSKERILAFAGIWKNLDKEFVDKLTVGLHKRRSKSISRNSRIESENR